MLPMIITKDEATPAQRTVVFYAVDATDGFTPETAIDFSQAGDVKLAKAGGALANAAGVVTELASGLYKLVLAAADVDTLGDLTVLITNAGVRPIVGHLQVVAFDLNTATVDPSAAGITSIQAGLATSVEVAAIEGGTSSAFVAMGTRTTDGNFSAFSMLGAKQTVITVTGTWDGATVTGQVCEDPSAAVPVWTAAGTPITANGTITLTGPHKAFRAAVSNDGAGTSLTATAAVVTAL
ncbi:MAG TPA: hypothetical protein VMZ53_03820 [Kofleriaceae bacterium]|nr:hypothetical protein [Kofleriaceae bacterium]